MGESGRSPASQIMRRRNRADIWRKRAGGRPGARQRQASSASVGSVKPGFVHPTGTKEFTVGLHPIAKSQPKSYRASSDIEWVGWFSNLAVLWKLDLPCCVRDWQ